MKIYGICLSNSKNSLNRRFLDEIIQHANGENIEYSALDFPMYQDDTEPPSNLIQLCEKLKDADGVIFSSPEYNGSFSPFGKNVIDWISILGEFNGSYMKTALTETPFMMCSVSPGKLGGATALGHLCYVIKRLGAINIKTFATIGGYNPETYDYSDSISMVRDFVQYVESHKK